MVHKRLFCALLIFQFLSGVLPVFASGFGNSLTDWEALMDWEPGTTGPSAPQVSASTSSSADPGTPLEWETIRRLWDEQVPRQTENRAVAYPALMSLAQSRDHPYRWDAIEFLWTSRDGYEAQYRTLLRPELIQVAQNPHDPHHWEAVEYLWCSRDWREVENQAIARPALVKMAQNAADPHQWDAMASLWVGIDQETQAQNRATIRPTMIEVAQNFDHPSQWNAIFLLSTSIDDQQTQNREAVRPALIAIVQNPRHANQREAIRLLRESDDPADQELGLALQLQYFPPSYSWALQPQIDAFNQETFKAHARKPLADLSGENMDLVAELTALMNQIDATNRASPFYLEAGVITGNQEDNCLTSEQNHARLQEIHQKARGFLKTLTGQPLSEGEESGWQMYEENTPALINALKHIVHALNKTEDPQLRLANLGIVLNGICYCPTGQSEGINSVVNTLIYGQNRLAGSFEERLHTIVREAAYQAFLNAFHEGGGAHGLSRARMVLGAHIGISQAIEGFQERISRVDDAEIPSILRQFYDIFTPEFLTRYLLNQVQTPEDLQRVVRSAGDASLELRHQIELDRQARPLLIGEILRGIMDRAQQENLTVVQQEALLTDFGFDTEGNGTLSQNGACEILRALGYLRR